MLQTLIDKEGLKGPRVLAVIPAKWLCDSWVVGPQVSAAESGAYSSYDRLVEANFPGSLKYIASTTFDHCLFDRTTCWYKMYVRTGDRKLLEAAYEGAQCLRTHTRMDGPDAGMFIPKGKPDLKYISPKMTGIDLAEELQSRHPRIKAILVSGYTPPVDTAAHGWSFLMKPFTIQR